MIKPGVQSFCKQWNAARYGAWFWIFAIVLGVTGAVLTAEVLAVTYGDISAMELKQRIDDEKDHGYLILDVRSVQEYNDGHIPEAINIPLSTIGYRAYSLDKSKDVIAYCGYGVQSKIACQILVNAGFKDVYNLTGGLQAWPYGLETTSGRVDV